MSNLGGFKLSSAIAMNGGNGQALPGNGKYSGAFESSIDGFVKMGSVPTTPIPEFVPMANGLRGTNGTNGVPKTSPPNPLHAPISEADEEISDVFTALSVKDPLIAAPGYGRGRSRRSSAPVNPSVQQYWSAGDPTEIMNGGDLGLGNLPSSRAFGSSTISSFNGWNTPTSLAPVTAPSSQTSAVSSIWCGGFPVSQSSRPNSQTSSHSNSSEQGSSSLSAFSPIYSPTTQNGFFPHDSLSSSLLTSNPLANSVSMAEQQGSPAFKVRGHVTCM